MAIINGPKSTDQIKYRNMFIQVILAYNHVRYLRTLLVLRNLNELSRANRKNEGSGCLWTFLLLISIANLFPGGNIRRSMPSSSTISITE